MNILVTGAAGQLGRSLRDAVAANHSADNYIFTDIEELDITDPKAVEMMVERHDIDMIVNCAAYTNVENAETDRELAFRLNAEAPGILARAIGARNGGLIHISTDYVFGGAAGNTPRTESEAANPTGVYGLSKLQGEEEIAASGCKAIILRTAWLYSEYGHNFVKTMLSLTESKPQLKVVFDQAGTPTYARDLADAIEGIISRRLFEGNEGIYHFSNEGVCSWYDFAKTIAEIAGHNNCNVEPCHSDEFPSAVVRPAYSVLDKTKYKTTFDAAVPYWRDSLKKCISNITQS